MNTLNFKFFWLGFITVCVAYQYYRFFSMIRIHDKELKEKVEKRDRTHNWFDFLLLFLWTSLGSSIIWIELYDMFIGLPRG